MARCFLPLKQAASELLGHRRIGDELEYCVSTVEKIYVLIVMFDIQEVNEKSGQQVLICFSTHFMGS